MGSRQTVGGRGGKGGERDFLLTSDLSKYTNLYFMSHVSDYVIDNKNTDHCYVHK